MGDWVTEAYEGMQRRQAERARAVQERAALVDSGEAARPTKAEQEEAEREARAARAAKQMRQYEAIAARMQRQAAARAKARPPMSEYDRQVVAQVLGEAAVDHWDGPVA